ncbi:hypothetical protein I0C86_17360 [Plantactinospora sp. S1510]|uniref:Uncharacterized protein n=1 Tax=Plantactinospora alkalitolerans TaxID=2789879 RepID=A0ABS0GWX9_9ACTN|nr:hypothetical protein [Plantactinospora alkalitolerans]MBF9130714.1 hypothetical protein [Plantactinospora alkalitolerans]
MSEPVNPTAAARPRPGSVTISSYLLYAAAVLLAVVAITGLSTIGTVSEVYGDAYAGSSVEGAEDFIVGVSAFVAVVQLLFAVGYVVLALLNNQGRNGARIATWVVAGLGVCCTGVGLGGTAAGGMNTSSTGDMPDPKVIQERLEDALPPWTGPLSLVCSILVFVLLLAVIVLLALPASNAFFRKQPAGFEPPVPGAAYPGQVASSGGEPAYPAYPQQSSGTDPAYPGQTPPSGTDPSNPPGPSSNPPGTDPNNPSGTDPRNPSGPPSSPPTS